MTDAAFSTYFWPAFFGFLGVLAVQIPIIIAAIKTNRKLDDVKSTALATKHELTSKVDAVQDTALATRQELSEKVDAVAQAAERQQHEVTNAFQAGERAGYVGGMEVQRQRDSGLMPLDKQQTDFNPLSN